MRKNIRLLEMRSLQCSVIIIIITPNALKTSSIIYLVDISMMFTRLACPRNLIVIVANSHSVNKVNL